MLRQCTINTDIYNNVTPLFLGEHRCPGGYTFGPAVRMYWLLHFVISGKGKYYVGDREFTLVPGEAFLIKPNEITTYQADNEDPWHYIYIAFDANIKHLNTLPYIIRNDSITEIMTGINNSEDYNNEMSAISKIWDIIGCLCGDSLIEEDVSYSAKAIDFIKKHYMEDISVQSIANNLGLDRSYFSNVFKYDTGKSPKQYLIAFRMAQAMELLYTEHYPLSTIAVSVGYSDIFTFSKAFKNYYGVPPQRFREVDKIKQSI